MKFVSRSRNLICSQLNVREDLLLMFEVLFSSMSSFEKDSRVSNNSRDTN